MRVFNFKLCRFSSRQLALELLSAEGLDMKKELNKVVLRQSVMNQLGRCGPGRLGEGRRLAKEGVGAFAV